MGKPPDGEYRELSMGKGGAYAKIKLGKLGFTHQIAYVHDTLPCYVKVNAGMFDDDKVTALTEHVHARLTADNRPR